VGTIEQTEASLRSRASDFLQKLGFSADLANAYANAYTAQGYQTTFRFRSGQFDWNIDEGVTIGLRGVNYIEVRADPPNWAGSATSPALP
jgi:hypothetical protein